MKYLTFEGTLETYYETGMEHLALGLQLSDERFKQKNSSFTGDPKNGPEYYYSLEGFIFLQPQDRLEVITDKGTEVFMIGNKSLAKDDSYRFGSAYPKEISSNELSQWSSFFAKNCTAKIIRPIKKLAFYGGTFDPIHLGHKAIIEQLHYQFDLVCVLPTNNWTKKTFTFSLEERLQAIEAVANNYSNVTTLDWSLYEDTTSTLEVFKKLKSQYGIDPVIVIGSDNIKGIQNWKNFTELKDLPFMVFQRGEKIINNPLTNCQILTNFNKNYSSTEIRNLNLIESIPVESRKFLNLHKIGKKD